MTSLSFFGFSFPPPSRREGDRSSREERGDGGVVVALCCFERGLIVPAADRRVRTVLQKLRDDGGVAALRCDPERSAAIGRRRLVHISACCDLLLHCRGVAVLRCEEYGL